MDADAPIVRTLVTTAERLDSLAEMADLMGDDAGAVRLRRAAANRRLEAMELLDE